MESCSTSGIESEICWFCKKGRHAECMKEIPLNAKSDGPHDCTFDTKWFHASVSIKKME